MSKQESLNWVNISVDELSGDDRKMFDAIGKAQEAFKAHMVAKARKAGALQSHETLKISIKPWAIGLAKITGKARTIGNGKDMFASL